MSYFIGQEVVELNNRPIWSMVYSGGTIEELKFEDVLETYVFLRRAMNLVDDKNIYRGPEKFKDEGYLYLNDAIGEFSNFMGNETISKNGKQIYKLRYSGGIIK